jgi:NTE family protein
MPSIEPVEIIPADSDAPEQLEKGIAICLSGGGFRAMLFHLGALWRLQELRYLDCTSSAPRANDLGPLVRVSSVSGGSITAGLLALRWDKCQTSNPDPQARVTALVEQIVKPIRAFSRENIAGTNFEGSINVIKDILMPCSVNEHVTRAYTKHLFGKATMADITSAPCFVINASNLQSGALWRFTKRYIRDWRVGEISNTKLVSLALAVSASSAFPPPLSPAVLKFKESDYTPNSGAKGGSNLQRPSFTTRVVLSDGGVYDNLGLETAWKRCSTLLVSDAGKPFATEERPGLNWVSQSARVIGVIQNQVRALRVRDLVDSFSRKTREGAYWGVGSQISSYPTPTPLPVNQAHADALALVATDLAEKSDATQESLINWGYAICDSALRSWVDPQLPAPNGFPFARGV